MSACSLLLRTTVSRNDGKAASADPFAQGTHGSNRTSALFDAPLLLLGTSEDLIVTGRLQFVVTNVHCVVSGILEALGNHR